MHVKIIFVKEKTFLLELKIGHLLFYLRQNILWKVKMKRWVFFNQLEKLKGFYTMNMLKASKGCS